MYKYPVSIGKISFSLVSDGYHFQLLNFGQRTLVERDRKTYVHH